jgi:transcriptional regulator with XRE-family HTH domain
MTIQQKLIALRKKKNISQEKLAELIGISRQAITKWECGESLPEIENIVLLCKYYGITIDSLLKNEEACNSNTIPNYEEIDLVIFLCKAKKETYAGNGKEIEPSRLASHDLTFKEEDLMYYDSYLGGKNFSGQEAIWKSNVPIWSMNYSGRVLNELFSGDFLKEALALVDVTKPFRGPTVYVKNEYVYHCFYNGNFEWFNGYEEIAVRNQKTYECIFHGGIIL